jgi:methionyl aminopeptidase
LELGIAQVKPGNRIRDIGSAIQTHAEERGYSVVRDFVGHGIGRIFHTAPQVPHYFAKDARRRMEAGMVFTIEPMINIGTWKVKVLDDAPSSSPTTASRC